MNDIKRYEFHLRFSSYQSFISGMQYFDLSDIYVEHIDMEETVVKHSDGFRSKEYVAVIRFRTRLDPKTIRLYKVVPSFALGAVLKEV